MFTHLWAIALGVLAAGLPVAVHLLTRPRPTRVPVSTLKFIREVLQQRRAAHRLRDFLILALRTLAVLLIAFALARPLSDASLLSGADETATTMRVVVVDVSQSMEASHHGIRMLERARTLAAGYLKYRTGLRANLILAAAGPAAAFEGPSTNFAALTDELNRCQALPQRINVKQAISAAGQMLAQGPPDVVRELIVVSDLQRSNWDAADFADLPEDTKILFESVAPEKTPANFAVVRAVCRVQGALGREGILEVEVGNYTPTPQTLQVAVTIGPAVYQLEGTCAAGTRRTLTQSVVLRELGWQTGEARLTGIEDALPADNVRPLVVEVRPPPTFALVTRQPASQSPTSSYFLERAILPAPNREQGGSRILRLDPARADRETLSRADLLIFDHPGKLTPEVISLVSSLVRRGRSMLYVASETIDAVNLKRLTEAAGSSLQMPVEFVPPPGGRARRDLFLSEVAERQAPFQVFGDSIDAALKPLRFAGGLDSRTLEGGLADDVLARYSDRSAALVTTSCGAGFVAVLNADLERSNLPTSSVFVPLVGELIDQLLAHSGTVSTAHSGEPFSAYLPSGAPAVAELELVGSEPAGQLVDEGTGSLWRMPAAPAPGVYEVCRGKDIVFAVAVTLPADESDLRPLPAEVLTERLAGGRQVQYRSASAESGETDVLWVWLATACVICLLAELIALRQFRT